MGAMLDKTKGYANEAIGKMKRAAGKAMNRPDIRAKGDAQEAKGDMQKTKGSIKGTINRL
jgi:uncharacterized protein YjbJ (UPF0337 family)